MARRRPRSHALRGDLVQRTHRSIAADAHQRKRHRHPRRRSHGRIVAVAHRAAVAWRIARATARTGALRPWRRAADRMALDRLARRRPAERARSRRGRPRRRRDAAADLLVPGDLRVERRALRVHHRHPRRRRHGLPRRDRGEARRHARADLSDAAAARIGVAWRRRRDRPARWTLRDSSRRTDGGGVLPRCGAARRVGPARGLVDDARRTHGNRRPGADRRASILSTLDDGGAGERDDRRDATRRNLHRHEIPRRDRGDRARGLCRRGSGRDRSALHRPHRETVDAHDAVSATDRGRRRRAGARRRRLGRVPLLLDLLRDVAGRRDARASDVRGA